MKVSKFFESLRVVVNSEEENVQLRWIYGIAIISVLLNLTLYGWKTLAVILTGEELLYIHFSWELYVFLLDQIYYIGLLFVCSLLFFCCQFVTFTD